MPTAVEPFYKELGRRIAAQRAKAGLTQDDVARELEPPVTRASIANIEGGKQRVLAHTLDQLAYIFGVEISSLVPPRPARDERERVDLAAALKSALQLSEPKARALSGKLREAKEHPR